MDKHHCKTMAETFCAELGIDPLGNKKSSHVRFKGLNAAFPREIVEAEVRHILRAHFGKLKSVDECLERTLLEDWHTVNCAEIKLPSRYAGGLLFGQLVPRFDNRIISVCPISGHKVPSRNSREFYEFRWAMQLANIAVAAEGDRDLRPLTAAERESIDKVMRESGHLTAKQLKEVVRKETNCVRDNLDTMLMHPDAKEALLLDPVTKLLTSAKIAQLWRAMPQQLQKRFAGKLRQGKQVALAEVRAALVLLNVSTLAFDAEVQRQIDSANSKGRKKQRQITSDEFLAEPLSIPRLDGRAAYSREILRQAVAEVMSGKHPKEKDGCLYRSEEIRHAQINREIAQQTNNHLVRHRLLILQRLLRDMISEFAAGDKSRIDGVTIEVTRDLREMSGKTNKQIAQELGLRLANFKSVVEKLEADESFMRKLRDLGWHRIPPGIIRKARIAEDLGWTCPYTLQKYEPIDLLTKRVDKDHIVPRSERMSDALDSLVITFSTINKWKGKRTALKFIEDEQGKSVPDLPNLSVITANRYKQFVEALEAFKGHDDDKRRKRKRKELLLLRDYEEQEFTPRDLTQTSQLVRLGALAIRKDFIGEKKQPVITPLPGSVTGTLRKGWNRNLLGCLSTACPQVLDANGEIKTKTDIRDITHLHHALDAIVLGLSAFYIPNNGRIWELIVKRKLDDTEKLQLRALGIFDFSPEGFGLKALPPEVEKQLRARLAEKRVVQHIPARIEGLRVEQNIWRVVKREKGETTLRQQIRQPDGKRIEKEAKEKNAKLLGLAPLMGNGKLQKLKGVLIIPENFGVALDPEPTIIPFHKVWTRLEELKKSNNGKMPRLLRNGQLIEVPNGIYRGIWRVFSAKNNASGMALDIGHPDVVRLKNKVQGHRINVLLFSLLKSGMQIVKTPLTGMATCPSTSSA